MTQTTDALFYLPTADVGPLVSDAVGKLTPVVTQDEETTPFAVYDCFDQSLGKEGLLLLETAKQFELWGAGPVPLSQSSERKGDFVSDLQDGVVKSNLNAVSPLRSLLVMGRGEMRRASLALVDEETKTHARANLRILTSADAGGIVILSLQALRGYDKAFSRLVDLIKTKRGAPLSQGSIYGKLFAGYESYDAKPVVDVNENGAALDAAVDIIRAYMPLVRRNEDGIIADIDTEFLHDYRVALRKIRSIISLFKGVFSEEQTNDLKLRFSALMAPTGRLRDLDVYLIDKDHYYDLLPAGLHDGLDRMFDMFAQERSEQLAQMSKRLKSKAYEAEFAKLEKLFAKKKNLEPGPNADLHAHDLACSLIWKRYRKICKIAEGIGPDTDDEEVHELRIQCKKLRYLMEFFAPVFPKSEFKGLIKPLKRLQDNLGNFNDYSVQQESLQEFLGNLSKTSDKSALVVAQSVGALIAVLHQRQLDERAKVTETFAHFNSPETQKTFRSLFHVAKRKDETQK